jgi:hypothetical protein
MKGEMFGVTVPGYHKYMDEQASMVVKLAGLIPVVNHSDLFETETVTYFNDLCLLAPSALIDKSIQWQALDRTSAKATYSNKGTTISAVLYFNEEGQLTNFVSDDRTAIDVMKKLRFSTPVSDYKDFNGYKLPSYGEAIWHYPDGEFTYGKIRINNIQYDIK